MKKNLQKIYESQNSIIYKGKYKDFENDVLIKILNDENPSEEKINRFNNEFEFTKDLKIDGLREVFKKDKDNGKNILILEYFDGQNLKKFFFQKTANFFNKLKIAINISQTIAEIHEQNIIHKDINSNNILIDENNKICIIDFGIATKYKLKNQDLSNIDNLEGTITHISPEQTGRMNRTVDYRSDLYSFGIILYEMFTGKLPFEEKDNMEILHSHITKVPVSPHKINSEIPNFLSQIILKLLSKNAEDRYQSAFGLKHDLQQLSKSSKLLESSFKLGEKDFSGKLSIPEKLYGRENEIKKLFEIYENISNAKKELLLISGLSGVGKSVLIHEIHKPLTKKNGFYIEGKFDQFQKDIPYFAIIQAFTDFANIILKENDENLKYWKNLIQKSVGNVGEVLTNLIPEFELIIGKQKEIPKLEGKENQNRFNYVWSHFVKTISNKKHPLIIFIDDLQWADNASIELLKLIVNDNEIKYFFPIIAYRDNEIDANDLQEFIDLENVNISNIQLGNLKQEDVDNLVNDTLNLQGSQKLANLIYSKTHGNAFFTVQFLTNLYEEEFLKFDFTKNIWNWNFEEIKKQNISDNVIELMKNKIHKLPKNTQDILKIASCIGNRFELRTLSIIYKKTEETAKNILRIAILENLIFPVDNRNFKFVHDKIQQAIYSTIPENEKNIFHLQTGKLLLKFLDKKDLEKRIFDVVNQINHGINLIENESERKQFAELNLQAGLKAKYSSAYFTSYNYLKISRNLLEKNSWKSNYEFTLQVYNEITEVSYLANDFKNTEKFVDIINNNIKKFIDKIHSNIMLIYSYNSQSFYDKSIYLALYLLKKFDFILPLKPSKIDVLKEFIKMELYFFIKKGTDFSKLPEMSDKKQEIIMKILSSIDTAVYHYQQLLFPIVSFKTSRLFVKYGAYKNNLYYFLTISVFYMEMLLLKKFYKIIDEIYKLSLKLNIQNNNEKFHFVYSYMNLFWFKKLHFIVEEFNTVFKIANEKGNLEYASYGLINNTYLMFFTDEKLTKIRKISIDNNIKLKKLNIKMAIEFNSIAIQMYENLINKTDKYCDLEGEYFEENKGVKSIILDKNYNNLSSYYIIKSILSIIFNDFNNIEIYLDGIEKYNKEFQFGSYYNTIGVFYSSLLYLQLYEKKRDKKFLNKAIKNQKLMKVWAKCCVENFQHKYDLVESEKFRLTGEKAKAQDFYNKAIKGANKNQFTSEEAISWEFAGRFYLEEKNEMLSKIYLQNAYKTYQKWDALSKLKQLEEKYPQFSFEKENTKSSSFTNQNTTIISSTATAIGTNSSSFDLESIVKASQSLSGEVKLEKLLKSILMIIMENAGADYAVIIKNDNENFTIEAKGKYGFENITVLQSENLDTSKSVILNMVKYVIRTKKSVLIDDISKNKDYENDEYLKNNSLKSVFCYPIIHKNKMVAILYLENSASSHAFTEERIKTINILSSQIAVSIENALLYENLENKVNQRTQELQKAKEKIEENHKHITDSINYAEKIQNAIFPSLELFKNNLSDYFIMFKPLDVVSGDFYWAKKINEHFIFVAADCTGHGVPGAFVSMLGISFLNEIVARKNFNQAGKTLDILREEIKISLNQNSETKRQEGMDIAFCALNTKTNVLQFAGANNPLYLFRNNEMIEYKADRQPIGIYRKEKPFTNYEIQLEKGDKIYIFSDGFIDQFGGKRNKKFMKKNFKKLLYKIQNENMNEQKEILENEFKRWKGEIKQIDDVLVMGVKI